MQRRGAQFTIRGLMIAVLIVAGVLALPLRSRWVAVVMLPLCLALFAAWFILVGRRRRLAAIAFWGLAIPVNILFAAACTVPGLLSLVLLYLWFFVVLPTLAGFGAVWAVLATWPGSVPQRSFGWAWIGVIALAVLPGVTSFTIWPFRLSFLAARPALERLADQVEAGQSVSFPRYAGPFRLAGSRVRFTNGGRRPADRP